MHRRVAYFVSGAIALACPFASGAAVEFDFKDPKGVNSILFVLDSAIEPIMGIASGISGKVAFDRQNPKSLTGSIAVESNSLHVSSDGMKGHLMESDWLDQKKHSTITFTVKEVKEAKADKDNNVIDMQVTGDFTLRGVTKSITIPLKATFLEGKLANRMRGKEGDLLVLRSNFTVKRNDFGIKPGTGAEIVSNDVELRVSIVGAAPKK